MLATSLLVQPFPRSKGESTYKSGAARIIAAQEDENRRIARDLHDVVNQRLAVLVMGLGYLSQNIPKNRLELQKQILKLRNQAEDLTREVRIVSHQLHPAILEHLGVAAALRSFCTQFSEQSGIFVTVNFATNFADINQEISLCLYRITQEALINVAKHSSAQHVSVELKTSFRHIELKIRDDGFGFDVEHTKKSGGIGLVTMQERARLVHGRFVLQTTPGQGTTIVVKLPLKK